MLKAAQARLEALCPSFELGLHAQAKSKLLSLQFTGLYIVSPTQAPEDHVVFGEEISNNPA